tara:strand:- start:3078 stop:3275 length:198 start_codon:yes stop_codon:yes gene_type:complete
MDIEVITDRYRIAATEVESTVKSLRYWRVDMYFFWEGKSYTKKLLELDTRNEAVKFCESFASDFV